MAKNIGSILIGLAYLALVTFIIIFSADRTTTFSEYAQYWGLFGTLVGVATGAIPGFFFKSIADKAEARTAEAAQRADEAMQRAERYAGAASPDQVSEVLGSTGVV